MDEKHTLDYQLIPLDTIKFPDVPIRAVQDPAALEDLTQSVRERGVLVPIIVVSEGDGYVLVAGARRVAAARGAGLVRIPAAIVESDASWECWARLCENRLREPLTAYDEARYLAHRISAHQFSQKEMADVLGVGPNWVSQRIRLLEWPAEVLEAVRDAKMPFAVGRELAGIESAAYRGLCVSQAVRSGCTVRQASDWRKASPKQGPSIPEAEASEVAGVAGGLILGSPGTCGNCGESYENVPALLMHLCEKCLQALGKGLSPGDESDAPSAPDG